MIIGRSFYTETIARFLDCQPDEILGILARNNAFSLEIEQRDAWLEQIRILDSALRPYRDQGRIYLEYSIPRLGKRIDAVALIGPVLFVIEFKVGDTKFSATAIDQVWDYALDLKNFHETSHDKSVVPVLVATRAKTSSIRIARTLHDDGLFVPIDATAEGLSEVIQHVLDFCAGPQIDADNWEAGRYCPTPTIIEAAIALYGGHAVADISRNDAGAANLSRTSQAISEIIASSKARSRKSICFVTGVPGAGKTLVGLDIATKHIDKSSELYSVFLSGNGPLVAILREALARDKVRREAELGRKVKKKEARSEVQLFIQNVHHFRDDCLTDSSRPPIEHVALFDEAQRAWDQYQTAKFMKQKKGRPNFTLSEPEFLISCLNRHADWAVVVCLVGGGQEINTGEAGISEWIRSLLRSFPDWHIHISPRLHEAEFDGGKAIEAISGRSNVFFNDELHLAVSMRSFRAEHVSELVKHLLDQNVEEARRNFDRVAKLYPIAITRDFKHAKNWLKDHARGSERFGIVVSSQAERLKPNAIHVKAPMNPIHWFLDGKDDVRSSYYLEDVATEFHVQGLELDWACVVWDADFRKADAGWQSFSFVGSKWNKIRKQERQTYLKNAYRVLLTRARQGMVIVVPEGDNCDLTRRPAYYDPTFDYLAEIGFPII